MLTSSAAIGVGLRLRVPAEAGARVARHPALRGDQAPETHRLHAVYFDTAAGDLRRSGLALRVRREGACWIETLERIGSAHAGLHERIAMDVPVAGPSPDVARWPPCPMTDELVAALAGRPLRRICTVHVTRSTQVVRRGFDTRIEATLDRGYIRSGGTREPLCELELALQAGAPAALYGLALELIGDVPIAVENRSRAERGYALGARTPEIPAKAEASRLVAPGMTVSEALDETLRGVVAHIQANEDGVQRHSDPEYVHQMRVALRRLRSALSVFRPVLELDRTAAVLAEVRWLARTLGAARDWDVFIESAYAQAQAAFPDHPGLHAYGREFRKRQRVARRRAQRAVASPRYQRLVLTLGAWLHSGQPDAASAPEALRLAAQPVAKYAAEALEARYARLRKRGRGFDERTHEELHELRIAAKKLRYAAQFFTRLYDGGHAPALLARLARLQDALGALNDVTAVQTLVQAVAPPGSSSEIAEARGILMAWSRGQAPLLRREAERAWRSVRRRPTFW